MKKSTLMAAFGGNADDGDDTEVSEESSTDDTDAADSKLDDALNALLDPGTSPEARREAFRSAVKAC